MIKLEKFQGHIALYCKGHYHVKGLDCFLGLRRIWSLRCGIAKEHISSNFDEYIANEMFLILLKCGKVKDLAHFMKKLHNEIGDNNFFICDKNLTSIQRVIRFYMSMISMLQVKDGHQVLIQLPEPQKELFNKILLGDFDYSDYYKVI